jgi:adenine deaminase
MDMKRLMAVSLGNAPSDLVLKNGRVINTFTSQVEELDVAICQGLIAGLGRYPKGKEVIDLERRYVSPGFIDGHIHLESSLLSPAEYARAVVPRGVLAVITDFHEIANVCGRAGIEYLLRYADHLPMDLFGMVPSCVPATHLESAGARLNAEDLKSLKGLPNIVGLGEMMNIPGVLSADSDTWKKLELFRDKVIDGHAPGLREHRLNAYIAAGIHSDHECTTHDEAIEKLNRGMYIMIREGTSEKNLDTLFPIIDSQTFGRCFFVVDDRSCLDLLQDGDVDAIVKKATRKGLDPIRAIQMATINPATFFQLRRLGAVAPGYRANLVVLEDLQDFHAAMVFYNGQIVSKNGMLNTPIPKFTDSNLTKTVHIKPFAVEDLKIPARANTIPVIEIIPDQIITKRTEIEAAVQNGIVLPKIDNDILKLVVVERHKASGNMGIALVKGFGLKHGAIASSIAHDSHNIISTGTNDPDIFLAIKELERLQGGLTIVADGRILASLPLPIAGLLSEEPLEQVVQKLEELKKIAEGLGCILSDPFATLSFLALPVIPEIRLTDLGLVDVMAFKLMK